MINARRLSLLLVALLVAAPAFAVGNGPGGGFLQNILSDQWSTAGIVALCSAVASAALAFSKFLPGYATKANIVVGAATAAGAAVGALGAQAGAIAILVALFGAFVGYTRRDTRAAAAEK